MTSLIRCSSISTTPRATRSQKEPFADPLTPSREHSSPIISSKSPLLHEGDELLRDARISPRIPPVLSLTPLRGADTAEVYENILRFIGRSKVTIIIRFKRVPGNWTDLGALQPRLPTRLAISEKGDVNRPMGS